jgi:hypothetical protein
LPLTFARGGYRAILPGVQRINGQVVKRLVGMLVEYAVQLDFGREDGGRGTELVDDLNAACSGGWSQLHAMSSHSNGSEPAYLGMISVAAFPIAINHLL